MLHKHDIQDKLWDKINKNFPGSKGYKGRTGVDNRKFTNAVLWILGEGVSWRYYVTRIWGLGEYTDVF